MRGFGSVMEPENLLLAMIRGIIGHVMAVDESSVTVTRDYVSLADEVSRSIIS